MMPPDGTQPLGDTQATQPGREKQKKIISLKFGATMTVLESKGNGTDEVQILMCWNVPSRDIVNKNVVLKLSDLSQNNVNSRVCAQLGGPVFVDVSSGQISGFTRFIEQQMEAAESARVGGGDVAEDITYLEVKEMDVYQMVDKYYFICGSKDVFLLNTNDRYSIKLSENDIEELDFKIVWLGKEVKTQFESDDKKATAAIVSMIEKFTSLVKNKKFHGFIIASIITHLRAYIYEHILKEHRDFYTSIAMSGEQRGTGKSLMFSVMQQLLYGRSIPPDKHVSDAMMFHKLAGKGEEGKVPVYVNEWDTSKASKLFNGAVKGVWEAGSYSSKSASNRPRTVLIVNANATPEDIKFDRGVKSKVSCIATPQDRLSHPQKLAITKQMVKDAKENHVQLPGILGYAIKNLLEKLVDEDVLDYSDLIEDDDDEREAQAHKDFDSLFYDIEESITKFELERPQLFNEQPDHTTLTFYNKKSKEQEAAEKRDEVEDQKKLAASNLIQHLIDGYKLSSLKYKKTKAIEGYLMDSLDTFPDELHANYKKATETFITTLEGRRKARIRYLPVSRISEEQLALVNEHLSSFPHLYSVTAERQRERASQVAKHYLIALELSCQKYDREHTDILLGEVQQNLLGTEPAFGDEMMDDTELGDNDNMDYEAEDDMTCGVPKCPQAKTVWKSDTRREAHRVTLTHKIAADKPVILLPPMQYPITMPNKSKRVKHSKDYIE